ncbi:MAG: hypothetical protein KC560_14570 [Myxococcales bacterium]|nr:hypothetical protein [Myxococcales bacterium]
MQSAPTSAHGCGRFAPSTTGDAHPGTFLAALLDWLDARSRGMRVVLRLEDLDPERSSPAKASALERDLAWLGLEWDATRRQSAARAEHEGALDRLAAVGALYPCACSRSAIRAGARRAPDGGYAYDNRCRTRTLPAGGWRASGEPLRARLVDGRIELRDESGASLAQDPAAEMGDPVVRRRDGSIAYQLASVVDDAREGVTRVVRGRDLAASTATQVALQRLLGLPEPVYRHHFLLLERAGGGKLAKLHGAVGASELRRAYPSGDALVGWLARAAGLRPTAAPVAARELVGGFAWERVGDADRVVRWTGDALVLDDDPPAARRTGARRTDA